MRGYFNILFANLIRMRSRSFAKLYKDIMITKRDLIDIRQSIINTIKEIKHADGQISKLKTQRKKWQNYQEVLNLAAALPQGMVRCQLCKLIFDNQEQLSVHKNKKHKPCGKCKEVLDVSLQDHLTYTCGQTELICEVCFASLKKKQFDKHIKICYFCECYKCKKQVSTRAYSYHLHQCKKNKPTDLITPCRQFIKNKEQRSLAIPCCLVLS